MVVRSADSPTEPWVIIGKDGAKETAPVEVDVKSENATSEAPSHAAAGEKRERSSSVSEEHQAKRVRVSPEAESTPPCLVPAQDPRARKLLDGLDTPSPKDADAKVEEGTDADRYYGAGDVFLTEGWRARWCRCKSVSRFLHCFCVSY